MEISTVPIIIDGPNFINRILELKIDKDIIAEQLTLDGFRSRLNAILEEKSIPVRADHVEFVCSKNFLVKVRVNLHKTKEILCCNGLWAREEFILKK